MAGRERERVGAILKRLERRGELVHSAVAHTPDDLRMIAEHERAYLAFYIPRFHNEQVGRIVPPEALKTFVDAVGSTLPGNESIPLALPQTSQASALHTTLKVTIRDDTWITETITTIPRRATISTAVYSLAKGVNNQKAEGWPMEPTICFIPAPGLSEKSQPTLRGLDALEAAQKEIKRYEGLHPRTDSSPR